MPVRRIYQAPTPSPFPHVMAHERKHAAPEDVADAPEPQTTDSSLWQSSTQKSFAFKRSASDPFMTAARSQRVSDKTFERLRETRESRPPTMAAQRPPSSLSESMKHFTFPAPGTPCNATGFSLPALAKTSTTTASNLRTAVPGYTGRIPDAMLSERYRAMGQRSTYGAMSTLPPVEAPMRNRRTGEFARSCSNLHGTPFNLKGAAGFSEPKPRKELHKTLSTTL